MRLREPELAEGGHLLKDLLGRGFVDAALPRAIAERLPVDVHGLLRTFSTHGAPEALRLAVRKSCEGLAHLEHLILEDDDTQCLSQSLFEEGMVVWDPEVRILTEELAAAHVWVDRTPHDGAGTHDGHLDRQVLQISGLDAPKHLDLGAALHLERTDGVTRADVFVECLIGKIDAGEVGRPAVSLRDQVHGLFHE